MTKYFAVSNGETVGERVWIATKDHISEVYCMGVWIHPVMFKNQKDPDSETNKEGKKGRRGANNNNNKATIKPRIWMGDVVRLVSMGVPIPSMQWASEKGVVSVLEWWKQSGLPLMYDHCAMDAASMNGHLAVLEWWKQSGLPLEYSRVAMDWASTKSHMPVSEYWEYSEIQRHYDEFAIREVEKNGNMAVLEWWCNHSGLNLLYTSHSMDRASAKGQVEVLEWWTENWDEFNYSKNSLNWASAKGHVEVLEWWRRIGCPLHYDEFAVDMASSNGHVEVLEWWKKSGLEIRYSKKSLKLASKNGHVEVLQWWRQSGFKLKYSDRCRTKYSDRCRTACTQDGYSAVSDWWKSVNTSPSPDVVDPINGQWGLDLCNSFLGYVFNSQDPMDWITRDITTIYRAFENRDRMFRLLPTERANVDQFVTRVLQPNNMSFYFFVKELHRLVGEDNMFIPPVDNNLKLLLPVMSFFKNKDK